MYECEILADSIGPTGKRLTTVCVTYPRFVHAELMTHRMFSRNSASSRAIPNEKLRQRVIDDPAMPVFWGKNQAGMAAAEELFDLGDPKQRLRDGNVLVPPAHNNVDGEAQLMSYEMACPRTAAQEMWLAARDMMLDFSERLARVGLHKQLCNRLIEPWMGITVIVSSTEWENFFRLRCHPAAQPEIRVAAEMIRDAMEKSEPISIGANGWHLPLVRAQDVDFKTELFKLSVARCARVSYLTHDGRRDPQADLDLYEKLATSGHWSPFEHAAQALPEAERIGNFIGWKQHRADVDPNFIR
jgi:hypothetical protein